MTATQTPGGDYVPAGPERTKRLTRGRKALIGLIVVAAAGAAAGGGTFASFTASTDNASADDPFTSAANDLILGNTVNRDGEPPGDNAECLSTSDVNDENAAECDVLFTVTEDDLEAAYVSYVRIENHTDPADDPGPNPFSLFSPEGCIFNNALLGGGDDVTLCTVLDISIQEYVDDNQGGDLDRITAAEFDDDVVDALDPFACVLGADLINNDTLVATPDGICDEDGGVALSSLPSVASPKDLGALATDPDDPDVAADENADVRFYKVVVTVPQIDAGCDDSDGFSTVSGLGCENHVAGGNAEFNLRWLIRES
jgi:predicted ribosomally synthesized peptide with SipW-like signal peptide